MNQRESQPAILGVTHRVTIYRNWKEREQYTQYTPSSHLLFHLACWPLPHSDPDSLRGPVDIYYDIETCGRWPSHIMVSMEKFKEIRSAFFFSLLFFSAGSSDMTGRAVTLSELEEERSVWTNGKNDQALTIWWLRERRGKESWRRGQ